MFGLSLLSGSATVFVSNITAEPNATTAQLSWTNVVSSDAVLAVPLLPTVRRATNGEVTPLVYLTALCTSTAGTPCQYTLRSELYSKRGTARYAPTDSSSTTILLPADGIGWLYYNLAAFPILPYLILQA